MDCQASCRHMTARIAIGSRTLMSSAPVACALRTNLRCLSFRFCGDLHCSPGYGPKGFLNLRRVLEIVTSAVLSRRVYSFECVLHINIFNLNDRLPQSIASEACCPVALLQCKLYTTAETGVLLPKTEYAPTASSHMRGENRFTPRHE